MEPRTFVISWIAALTTGIVLALAGDTDETQSEAIRRSLPRALGLATVIAAAFTFGVMTR
jgi:hypothetical protein